MNGDPEGPQRPPKLLCVLCDLDITHQHHDGQTPVTPCRACLVGVHWACDPLTFWCACDCGLGKDTPP